MKLFPSLVLSTLLVVAPACGQEAAPAAAAPAAAFPPPAVTRSVEHPWSVVGTWDCTNRYWTNPLDLKPDGTFTGNDDRLTGRWMLGVQGGQVMLTLYWNYYSTELLPMINADEFHGSADRGDLRMRRHADSPVIRTTTLIPGFGEIETRAWSQGEPPVKLLRKEEGFCALTKVTGHFAGDGESVRVHVAEDGYWYLDGDSHQEGVGAECLVVRYRK